MQQMNKSRQQFQDKKYWQNNKEQKDPKIVLFEYSPFDVSHGLALLSSVVCW